jgi:hypothetical protein
LIEYDKIVIGSSLSAVLYAFNNKFPIFFAEERRPFRFDYLEPALDLSCLKIPGAAKSLTTLGSEKNVGVAKELLWERLLFLLSLDGNAPLSSLCHSIRYDGDRVVCSNEYSKIMEFKFNECIYFGDEKSTGFTNQKGLDEDSYVCYDYIAFNKGGKHEIDHIRTNDDFVSEIWFYGSDRIDGNTPVRDACAVSKLTGVQLADFDFSETMARFKVVYEMEQRGMKGQFAGGYTTAGNPKYYKFRTTSIRRQTDKRRVAEKPETENIKIAQYSEGNLLEDIPQASMAYNRFLRHLGEQT